jgi:tripartite-type tricarboxylate transporter receptor subunit TctC
MNCKVLLAAAALIFPMLQARADYPEKPIKIIVPFAPGGVADNSIRVLTQALSVQLKQQVFIENKAGASGNIGTAAAAIAAPDGYTLLLGFDGTMAINPHMFKNLSWDPVRDFAAVTKLGDATLLLVAHPSLGVANLTELVALSNKNKQRKFSYGTSGTGGTPHLAMELLKLNTGVLFEHIPYKGGALALNDALGGHIPLSATTIAAAQQYVTAGKLVGLGIPSAKRSPVLPDVPTFTESGVPDMDIASWTGIFAPAKTPRPIIEKLRKEILIALQTPEVRKQYLIMGIDPSGNTPEQFSQQLRDDLSRWGKIVKDLNLSNN